MGQESSARLCAIKVNCITFTKASACDTKGFHFSCPMQAGLPAGQAGAGVTRKKLPHQPLNKQISNGCKSIEQHPVKGIHVCIFPFLEFKYLPSYRWR